MFFFERKNQKTFTSPQVLLLEAMASIVGAAQKIKVFCFFSSEKKAFPSGDERSGGSQRLHLCPSVSICGLPSLLFPSWRDVGRGTWFVPIVS
jgi:hypothetical protein